MSHNEGRIFPIERLAKLGHTNQALLIINGTQAVGHIPVKFQDWQPAAYFFSGPKWCAQPISTGAVILGKQLKKRGEMARDIWKETNQPSWEDFEIGTQNIGLTGGLAKACQLKQQATMKPPIHDKIRVE